MVKRKSITGRKTRRKLPHVLPTERLGVGVSRLATTSPSRDSRSTSIGLQSKEFDDVDNTDRRKLRRTDIDGGYKHKERQSRLRLAVLKPCLRYVHQDVIKDKWNVLPELLQDRIKQLFKSIERPVIASYRDDKKRIEAQVILSSITRTLAKRLPRMPFPPNTKETHLDYEAIVQSIRNIEQQLTPSLHATTLLKAKILQEQQILKEEKAQLEELKKNAKAEESRHRRQQVKRYVSLRVEDGEEEIYDQPDSIGLEMKSHRDPTVVETSASPSMQAVVEQLQSHLESMDGNLSHVVGISDALLKANATLDELLNFKSSTYRISG